jgi:hypothetical protein
VEAHLVDVEARPGAIEAHPGAMDTYPIDVKSLPWSHRSSTCTCGGLPWSHSGSPCSVYIHKMSQNMTILFLGITILLPPVSF